MFTGAKPNSFKCCKSFSKQNYSPFIKAEVWASVPGLLSCTISSSLHHYPASACYWKPSFIVSGRISVLICTWVYFNKAIKLKLDNSQAQMEQVGGSYSLQCIVYSAIELSSLIVPPLDQCVINHMAKEEEVKKRYGLQCGLIVSAVHWKKGSHNSMSCYDLWLQMTQVQTSIWNWVS